MDSNRPTQLNTIKRCRLCGGKAVCYNFNVLTCGPCRLFFYRNVNRFEDLECTADSNCEISYSNKRNCRKCRLEKCVQIGMKQKPITKNKKNYTDKSTNCKLTLKSVLESDDFPINGLRNECLEISLPQRVSKNFFEFNQTEVKYIDELLQSSSLIFNFDEANLPVLYETSNIYQSFNLGMHYVRRVIKYCKSNSVFRSLNEQEQYKVLKQFINKFFKIRHSYAYDHQIGGFYSLGSEDGNCSVVNKCTLFSNTEPAVKQLVDSKQKLIVMLSEEMAFDKTIRDLMIVQALFGCNQDNSNAESLRYHYWIYNSLLLRYLQCKYKNMQKAQDKYSILIKVASELMDERQIQQVYQLVQKLDTNQFDELTAEILNISVK